jgi:hypothetical protein
MDRSECHAQAARPRRRPLLLPQAASAKSHLWKFTEIFSNQDGSIQFIEMFVFDPAGRGEWFTRNKELASDANTYVFPNNLP